jgi:hypothetical protein
VKSFLLQFGYHDYTAYKILGEDPDHLEYVLVSYGDLTNLGRTEQGMFDNKFGKVFLSYVEKSPTDGHEKAVCVLSFTSACMHAFLVICKLKFDFKTERFYSRDSDLLIYHPEPGF